MKISTIIAIVSVILVACLQPLSSSSTSSAAPSSLLEGSPTPTTKNTKENMLAMTTTSSLISKDTSEDLPSTSTITTTSQALAPAPKDPTSLTNKDEETNDISSTTDATISPPNTDDTCYISPTPTASASATKNDDFLTATSSSLPVTPTAPASTFETDNPPATNSSTDLSTDSATTSIPSLPLLVRIFVEILWRFTFGIFLICYKILPIFWTVLGWIIAKSSETTANFILTWFFPLQWSWWTLPFKLPFSALYGVLGLMHFIGGTFFILVFVWVHFTGLDFPESLYEAEVQLILLGFPFSYDEWHTLLDESASKLNEFCKKIIPGWKRLEAKWIICGWNVHHYHSFKAIKKHYHKKALKFHPDKYNPTKNGNTMTKDEATAHSRKIKDAYNILKP